MNFPKTIKLTKRQKRKAYIVFYLYMLLVLLSLFVVASYTWFSLSSTPRVSDMNMYITTQAGLELSTDPNAKEWVLQLDFRDIVNETTPLRPVTWSEEKQSFIAASYGFDGRLQEFDTWHVLTDERNANTTPQNDGYYIKATFFARCGQNVDVTLSPAVEVNEGIDGSGTYIMGVPVWNPRYEPVETESTEETIEGESTETTESEPTEEGTTEGETEEEMVMVSGHDNGGMGAENAIRFGFRVTYLERTFDKQEESTEETTEPTGDATEESTEATEETTEETTEATEESTEESTEATTDATEESTEATEGPTNGNIEGFKEVRSEFFIFEPNCDLHVDGSTGYIPTPSIDGTETLIDLEHLIRQSATTWTDADPIEHGVVIKSMGELIDNPILFSLRGGQIAKIDLYIWLEGQDIDCINQTSGAQIQANIQFTGNTESQSGMEMIE